MENFIISVNAVLPMFCIIALGFFAQRIKLLDYATAAKMNSVAFKIFLPCLLFHNIYEADLKAAVNPPFIAFCTIGILVAYFLATVVVCALEKRPEKRAVMIQGIFRSNFILMGLPLAQSVTNGADLGSAAVMMAIAVPMFNVLAVITLEVYRGNRPDLRKIGLDIIKNPLIIGSMLGILALLLGVKLPYIADKVVNSVSAMATPLTLFLLGASFRIKGVGENRRNLIITSLGRLVVVPGLAFIAAALMGFRGLEFVTILVIFCSPNAVSSFTMAQHMGGDADLAASIVVFTSGFSCLTMFCWTFLSKQLGMF